MSTVTRCDRCRAEGNGYRSVLTDGLQIFHTPDPSRPNFRVDLCDGCFRQLFLWLGREYPEVRHEPEKNCCIPDEKPKRRGTRKRST